MAGRCAHEFFQYGEDRCKSKLRHAYFNFNHMCTKECLWSDGCYNPPWVGEELRRRGIFQGKENVLHDESSSFISLLRACAKSKDLHHGIQVHNDVLSRGLLGKCSDALITMYAKCGEVVKAKELLDANKCKDVFSWTDLITGYVEHGQGQNALECFEQMKLEGLSPDPVTFVSLLRACGSMKQADRGEQVHYEIARFGLLQKNIVIGNAVVDMYAKCGALVKARQVLEELRVRNVICWTALITGYAQHGQGDQALKCFDEMQQDGFSPNAITSLSVLKACSSTGAVDRGEQIHNIAAKKGLLENNTAIGNAIVNMYAKCGALVRAQEVLEELPMQNVVTWNALISGFIEWDHAEQALNCYQKMLHKGILPNTVTYICVLKACASLRAIEKGEQIHDEIVRQGILHENIALGTAVVDMYAKCGALAKAERVHEKLPLRDVVSWSALIAGYALQGQGQQALNSFEQMQRERILPNAVTMLSVLKACGSVGAADKGKQFHDEIVRQGWLKNDLALGTALVDMYAKCSALPKAQEVLEGLTVQNAVPWNALIAGYVEQGQTEQAFNCYKCMKSKGLLPDSVTFLCMLKACGNAGAIDMGEQVHDEIAKQALLPKHIILGNAVVDMYAKCGALEKAQCVFEKLPTRDVFSWSSLIAGYAQQSQGKEALKCLECMQREGLSPNAVTFLSILKACGNIGALDKGEQIHDEIIARGLLKDDVALGTALVDMYAKCGALAKAQEVLENLHVKNVVSWNALIGGCAEQGNNAQSLYYYERMKYEGLSPDGVTFLYILKACGSLQAADMGEQVHDDISKRGLLEKDIFVGNALVEMYVKCGALLKAQQVLNELPLQDLVTWNVLIDGYAQQGKGEDAINLVEQMQQRGLSPNAVTFLCSLQACGCMEAAGFCKGEEIYCEIARQGFLGNNIMLGTALVDMYVKCCTLSKAQQVLEELPVRDVVTWNALLVGSAQQGQGKQVLVCFEQMQAEGHYPDAVTFSCILKAFGSIGATFAGKQIHDEIAAQGLLGNDIVLGTSLVDMYAKCSAFGKAQEVFGELPVQNVISWNALLAGYAQQGQGEQAFKCFEKMRREGVFPDVVTFLCMLKACGSIGAADKGEQIHHEIARQGLLVTNVELGNAVVDMYAKCGALMKAQEVFEKLPVQNVVSWNSLITGYAQQGQAEEALDCFAKMQRERLSPDVLTFISILKACGSLGASDKGEDIHDEIIRSKLLEKDTVLGTAVVDMYAKCGALVKAQQVLEDLPFQTTVSWNALIKGCAQQGQAKQALTCLQSMHSKDLSPDAVTFVCILKACGSMGLVNDAQTHFLSMSDKYGIKPDLEHYNCMVDIFGRAGHLDKAVDLIQRMPSVYCTLALWSALLGACAKWGDMSIGKWAFEQAIRLDKNDGAAYALMAKIYAAAGLQKDAEKIEAMRKEMQEI
ncbi:hypothetical protein GOP47_0005774 [Adiantum capillus-veneris]|uniref:Pentatricopeptide repeat-containing protein n=1 Tax=Adiantum capillus-veneris TaxID=13818 RepID=A0A9D4V5P7_ADICA|nr:hypothetical protein GOP47_0005774 [Adiantum capillus-veneris]